MQKNALDDTSEPEVLSAGQRAKTHRLLEPAPIIGQLQRSGGIIDEQANRHQRSVSVGDGITQRLLADKEQTERDRIGKRPSARIDIQFDRWQISSKLAAQARNSALDRHSQAKLPETRRAERPDQRTKLSDDSKDFALNVGQGGCHIVDCGGGLRAPAERADLIIEADQLLYRPIVEIKSDLAAGAVADGMRLAAKLQILLRCLRLLDGCALDMPAYLLERPIVVQDVVLHWPDYLVPLLLT